MQVPLVNETKAQAGSAARAARAPWSLANNCSPEEAARKADASRGRRREGYRARGWLWEHSSVERVRRCGRVPLGDTRPALIRGSDNRAFYAGIETCGSSGLCPTCAAKIRTGRAAEVEQTLGRWRASNPGGDILFATFTMRHHAGHKLEDLWDALTYAWRYLTSGKGWVEAKATHGIDGYVRVVEATHGANGWHLHIHAAVPMRKRLTETEETVLREKLFSRWVQGLEKNGLTAIEGVGVDVRRTYSDSGLGRYLTKAAAELTRGDVKKANGDNRTPFRILFDLAEGKEGPRDAATWREWEKVSRGRRFITWSKSLRAYIEDEKTDEDLAAEQEAVETEVVATFMRADWVRLIRTRGARGLATLLDVCESSGAQAARDLLDAWGIRWGPPIEEQAAA